MSTTHVRRVSRRFQARAAAALALLLAASALPGAAQNRGLPPGVELAGHYSRAGRPLIAIRPFSSPMTGTDAAAQIATILRNDLGLSDRFEFFPVTDSLSQPGPVDYAVWNSLRVVWLITGDVTPTADGFQVFLTAHDVVYGTEKQSGSFSVPAPGTAEFRMAVHVASDAIVRWITGQPGMAASRIAFVRQNGNGTSDMLVVDSDGENLRRIMGSQALLYSPGWSPDGVKLAYASPGEEGWHLMERDMATGRTRILDRGSQLVGTPVFTPDGSKVVFARWLPGRGSQEGYEIHEYDVTRNCCLARLTDSNADNIGPSLSADGRRFVFMSTRTGRHHIYVANSDGAGARIITPVGEGVEYNGPDWSPTSSTIVFEGMSRGTFQIMTANADRPGGQVTQLTSSGDNKDPSFAPDGRHIVYTGSGAQGEGLYVIDAVTGTVRLLARGARLKMADWSPSLAGAVSANN